MPTKVLCPLKRLNVCTEARRGIGLPEESTQTQEAMSRFTGKTMDGDIAVSLEYFSDRAEVYDAHRPRPPAAIPDMLTQLARTRQPRLVVDLGSGTGLSTFIWADRSEATVGIEPNAGMRGVAEARKAAHANATNVRFQEASPRKPDSPMAVRISSRAPNRCTGWSQSPRSPRSRASCGAEASLPRMITRGYPRWTGRPRRPLSLSGLE